MTALAAAWLKTLGSLGEHGLRVAFALTELSREPPREVAAALDSICRGAEQGEPPPRDALAAFVPLLVDPDHIAPIEILRGVALDARLLSLGRLLRGSTLAGHELDRDTVGEVAQRDGRPLMLGERRALARQPTRRALDELMRDPHPMVAAVVLTNPRITELDVLRMAAHRPAKRAVMSEIAKRWSRRGRVRMAIVLNPGAPPAVAVPLLGLLTRPELGEVARAADLRPLVRATARELYDLRPPLPPADPSQLPH
jgi:hypothetical protein